MAGAKRGPYCARPAPTMGETVGKKFTAHCTSTSMQHRGMDAALEQVSTLCKSPLDLYAWLEALEGPEDVIYLQDLPRQGNDICGVADEIERRGEINMIQQERERTVGIGSYQRTAVGLRR